MADVVKLAVAELVGPGVNATWATGEAPLSMKKSTKPVGEPPGPPTLTTVVSKVSESPYVEGLLLPACRNTFVNDSCTIR